MFYYYYGGFGTDVGAPPTSTEATLTYVEADAVDAIAVDAESRTS